MAASWGKKATARVDRSQFGKDELLQSLGTQFNVDFTDYEQWTRKAIRRPPPPKVDADKSRSFVIGQAGQSFLSLKRTDSADSCRHGSRPHMSYMKRKKAAKLEEEEKERAERIKILELKLKTRKQTLDAYEKRYAELIEENILLQADIEADEQVTLDGVKGLLRKYEKYRGGITTINTHFNKEYEAAKKDLEETKQRIRTKLDALEAEVEEMDAGLKERQGELHILMNYKDKEYPVKAMRISNLQKEIQSLKIANEEDQEELEHIVRTELGKYEKDRTMFINHITKDVTEQAISMMHPSLKDMALQNMVMKKELELHKKQQAQLEMVTQALEKDVQKLLQDPKTNTRLMMFPEFFPPSQKCTPDMEVVLDIPTQEWLPI